MTDEEKKISHTAKCNGEDFISGNDPNKSKMQVLSGSLFYKIMEIRKFNFGNHRLGPTVVVELKKKTFFDLAVGKFTHERSSKISGLTILVDAQNKNKDGTSYPNSFH